MAIVPFQRPTPQARISNPEPMIDDTYLAIAAAGMHEMDRLFEKPLGNIDILRRSNQQPVVEDADHDDQADLDEANKPFKLPPESD